MSALLQASLLTVAAAGLTHALQVLIWPWRSLRGAVVALALLLNAAVYGLVWETPGLVAVLLAMGAAGHLLRAVDAVLGFPEASRREFALFLAVFLRHPTRDRRTESSAAPGLRVARGLALVAASLGLVALGARLRPWTWSPWLDDLWMAAELGCLFLGLVELVSPLARRLGIGEAVLFVEGLALDFAWSPSLGAFWSVRWNLPVANMLRRACFVPLGGSRRLVRATLGVFLVSGLVHAGPMLLGGLDRALWAWLAAGTLAFFLIHGLVVALESALPRAWRRGPVGRVTFLATFLLTLPLYPAPLLQLMGVHGRPVEALTPVVIARTLGGAR